MKKEKKEAKKRTTYNMRDLCTVIPRYPREFPLTQEFCEFPVGSWKKRKKKGQKERREEQMAERNTDENQRAATLKSTNVRKQCNTFRWPNNFFFLSIPVSPLSTQSVTAFTRLVHDLHHYWLIVVHKQHAQTYLLCTLSLFFFSFVAISTESGCGVAKLCSRQLGWLKASCSICSPIALNWLPVGMGRGE